MTDVVVAKQRASDTGDDETSSTDDDAQQHTTQLRRLQRFLSASYDTGQYMGSVAYLRLCGSTYNFSLKSIQERLKHKSSTAVSCTEDE